jgi:hypothetical protein
VRCSKAKVVAPGTRPVALEPHLRVKVSPCTTRRAQARTRTRTPLQDEFDVDFDGQATGRACASDTGARSARKPDRSDDLGHTSSVSDGLLPSRSVCALSIDHRPRRTREHRHVRHPVFVFCRGRYMMSIHHPPTYGIRTSIEIRQSQSFNAHQGRGSSSICHIITLFAGAKWRLFKRWTIQHTLKRRNGRDSGGVHEEVKGSTSKEIERAPILIWRAFSTWQFSLQHGLCSTHPGCQSGVGARWASQIKDKPQGQHHGAWLPVTN